MTTTFDFDRLLGSVLDSDGPQAVPPGLVDAALARARTVEQRRPLIRVLDWRAWPRMWTPLARETARRLALGVLLALLVIAAIASAVLIGSERPPRLLGDGERLYVWSSGNAHLISAVGAEAHTTPEGRIGGACPTLVAGTTVVGQFGFGAWDFTDLATGSRVASVGNSYSGFERWSPDFARLALVDFGGRVGVVSFDDATKPATRWFDVPGVLAADWSLDGDQLAVVTNIGRTLTIDVIDLPSGTITPVHTESTDPATDPSIAPPRSLLWSSHGSTVALLVSAPVTSGTRSTVTILDLETRAAVALADITGTDEMSIGEGAWSPDGEWFALPTSASAITIFDRLGETISTVPTHGVTSELAWSADSRAVALLDADELVVADRTGRRIASASLGLLVAFHWDRSAFAVLVARPAPAGVVVDRYRGDDLEMVAQALSTVAGATDSGSPSRRSADPSQPEQICLQLDGATAVP